MAEEKKTLKAASKEDLCNMYGLKAEQLEDFVKNGILTETEEGVQIDLEGLAPSEREEVQRYLKDGKVGGCGCGCGGNCK